MIQSLTKKRVLCILILCITATCYLACTKTDTKPAIKNTPVTIASISIVSGTYNTKVVITGTGFDATTANDKVFFNGTPATVSAATATQLTVSVPLNAGTGNITLSVDDGTTVSGPLFTYNTPVAISSINANSGTYNTKVVITGTGFDAVPANNKVFFNGKAATVSAATTTQLTVTVPLNAGTGNITLSVDGGTTVSGPLFTYNTPVAISSINANSGTYNTKVVITGTGFDAVPANNKVFFNGKAATVSAATTTQLTVTVPLNAGTGNITLSVDDGTTVSGPLFTYNTPVAILSINANSGTYNTKVVITGTGFDAVPANNKVFFNGKAATVSAATTTQLTVTVPLNAGTGNITLSVDNGAIISGPLFTYNIQSVTISSISVNAGPYNTVVVITGIGFDATAAKDKAFFNGKPANVSAATTTQLTVTVPLSAGTGNITLSVDNGVTVSGPLFTYQYSAIVTTLAGNPNQSSKYNVLAYFNNPTGVAIDAAGNIYVDDASNNLIAKITPGGVISTVAGTSSGQPGNADGTGTSASFNIPQGITVDAAGNIYVADTYNNLIRKVTPAGVVTTIAGSGTKATVDGTGKSASFYYPYGIAADAAGNLYVTSNNFVRKIGAGRTVTTLAGNGNAGMLDGTGAAAYFDSANGIAVDAAGNLFVADYLNNEIRKITQAGVVATFAGGGYSNSGSADGTGKSARFFAPSGIAVDKVGNLYIADTFNNRIRMVTPGGVVTTIAGSGAHGSDDGTAKSASFAYPRGIAVDAAGNIYVADTDNGAIRKIAIQ